VCINQHFDQANYVYSSNHNVEEPVSVNILIKANYVYIFITYLWKSDPNKKDKDDR